MRFTAILAALPFIGAALAETIVVKVGANGTLAFDPAEVTAVNGDVIAFQFLSKNHTVTQSTFAQPCANISDTGLDSGFQPVAADATSFMQYSFTMTNVSGPLWFYCRQAGHCAKGMVFAVNPTAEKSFAAFQALAMGATANTTASGSSAAGGAAATSASASGTAASATGTTNGAGSMKVGGGLLLGAVSLAAGLML